MVATRERNPTTSRRPSCSWQPYVVPPGLPWSASSPYAVAALQPTGERGAELKWRSQSANLANEKGGPRPGNVRARVEEGYLLLAAEYDALARRANNPQTARAAVQICTKAGPSGRKFRPQRTRAGQLARSTQVRRGQLSVQEREAGALLSRLIADDAVAEADASLAERVTCKYTATSAEEEARARAEAEAEEMRRREIERAQAARNARAECALQATANREAAARGTRWISPAPARAGSLAVYPPEMRHWETASTVGARAAETASSLAKTATRSPQKKTPVPSCGLARSSTSGPRPILHLGTPEWRLRYSAGVARPRRYS